MLNRFIGIVSSSQGGGLVTRGAVFYLDAGVSASYSGSGTTWANLITSPADSSAQTDNDFKTGDGSTSSTYPTFNGPVGSHAAYWSFDGGDNFRLKSGTNTTFMNSLSKNGATFTAWAVVRFASIGGDVNYRVMTNGSGASTWMALHGASGNGKLQQQFDDGMGAAGSAVTDNVMYAGITYFVCVSFTDNVATSFFFRNGSVQQVSASDTFTLNPAGSGNPSNAFSIGSKGDNGEYLASGSRLYACGMANVAWTNAEVLQHYNALKSLKPALFEESTIEIKMWGAGGAGGYPVSGTAGPGGGGGYATGIWNLSAGTVLKVAVGGGGIQSSGSNFRQTGPYKGGGDAAVTTHNGVGGTGGGLSGVFIASVTQGNSLLVAGGGGGGKGHINASAGGAGGGSSGVAGNDGPASGSGGGGGTQSAGGAAGTNNYPVSPSTGSTAGTALQGGMGNHTGGGGGGGYYGGGGAGHISNVGGGGGGGGSGYVNTTYSGYTSSTLTAGSGTTPGNSGDGDRGTAGNGGASTTNGVDGKVMIRKNGGSWTTFSYTGSDQTYTVS